MPYLVFVILSNLIFILSYLLLPTFGVLALSRTEEKEMSLIVSRRVGYAHLRKNLLLYWGLPFGLLEGICLFIIKGSQESPSLLLMTGAFFVGFAAELCISGFGLLYYSVNDHKLVSGILLFAMVGFYAGSILTPFPTIAGSLGRSITKELLAGCCFILLFLFFLKLSKHCYQKRTFAR